MPVSPASCLAFVSAVALCAASSVWASSTVTIDFEDQAGQSFFNQGSSTTPLRNEYASQGVLFEESLADSNDKGGWVWNTGISSLQHTSGGTKALAFNPANTYDGGGDVDSEQVIRFTAPVQEVSMWVLWNSGSLNDEEPGITPEALLLLHAVDETGAIDSFIDSDSVNNVGPNASQPGTWYQLTVSAGAGEQIDRVELNVINREDFDAFRVDDIVVTFVPEPSSLAFVLLGGLALVSRRR